MSVMGRRELCVDTHFVKVVGKLCRFQYTYCQYDNCFDFRFIRLLNRYHTYKGFLLLWQKVFSKARVI